MGAQFNLSSQEFRIPGETLDQKLDRLEEWGITALEPNGGGLADRAGQIEQALRGRNVRISVIVGGYQGAVVAGDEKQRELAVVTARQTLEVAGALGAIGMILVPAFERQEPLESREGRKVLLDALAELGEHAAKCGTRVLLEPLNRREAFFLRQLADAAAICREVDSPGVAMMGDFYHMGMEETSQMGAFLSAGAYLRHVHLATYPNRLLPGQEPFDYTDGFRALKMLGYQGYCSFEARVKEGTDAVVEFPKSIQFLKEQWENA